MYLIDYHIHSSYSPDGNNTFDEMCEAAIARGLNEITFTDHFDPTQRDKLCKESYNQDAIFNEIETIKKKYADRLIVRLGVESGESQLYPESTNWLINSGKYDFILGSLHNITGDNDIAQLKDTDEFCSVIGQYFDELLLVAKTGLYDCVGHLDYPKRYAHKRGIKVDFSIYFEIFREILKSAIANGRGIEVNLSGFRHGLGEPLPSISLIKLYKELGGEIITLGSDAHRVSDIGSNVKDGMEILSNVGFKYFTTFEKRVPKFIKI